MENPFQNLPSVDRVLSDPRFQDLLNSYTHSALAELVRNVMVKTRRSIASGSPPPAYEDILAEVLAQAQSLWQSGPRPVINATGVILHTNLGRAPLSYEAVAAVGQVAQGYSNLEADLLTGERGSRQSHVEHLLCQITGAEGALVVNNNASAVLLGLTALAQDKEVIVSRGQAVEIGGGFRIPEVMRQSGATLVEVGTTNRTYIDDYEKAITERTAALLRVHTSNFKLVGFVHSAALEEMMELGHRHSLLILDDLGSGCLLDTTLYGLEKEPMVQESIAAGVDLAFFSADKLLGGPQGGVILGKKALVDQLGRHPLARALRIDKLSLAALSVTLLHYLKGEATTKIPVWRMISTPLSEVERRARTWTQVLGEPAEIREGQSVIGGGSLPESGLPTKVLAIPQGGLGPRATVQSLAERLRSSPTPVIGRIEKDILLLDPRTVLPEEDEALINVVKDALETPG